MGKRMMTPLKALQRMGFGAMMPAEAASSVALAEGQPADIRAQALASRKTRLTPPSSRMIRERGNEAPQTGSSSGGG